MHMFKNDDWPLHQKSRFFIASKLVHLSLDILLSRKPLKHLLQNIYIMSNLLYHKRNPLITAIADDNVHCPTIAIFLRISQIF